MTIWQQRAVPANRDTFYFPHWSAAVATPAERREAMAPLSVTDVTVYPDSKYGFAVMAGARTVISFFFDDMDQAIRAGADMRRLLPSVTAVLRARSRRPPPASWHG
jgi:hypothetical protein